MSEAVENNTLFSTGALVSLFAIEACYFLFLYDPVVTKIQAGLMLVFAAEAGCMVKVASAQLGEKRAFGKVSLHSRLYSAIFFLPLLAVMAISLGAWRPARVAWLMIALLFVSLLGKIAWHRHFSRLFIQGVE